MDNLIDRIKDNWLEWKSLPYAFVILVMAFLAFASLPNLLSDAIGYLYLGLIFAAIFIIYVFFCAIHVSRMKKAGAAASNEAFEMRHKSKLSAWMAIFIGCVVLAMVIFLIVFTVNKDDRDGKYVIWSKEYNNAMSSVEDYEFYLAGKGVTAQDGKLINPPDNCIFELDFNKDNTFTIKQHDNYFGVKPEENGIGCKESNTSILWKLEKTEGGAYHIINVDEGAYLKIYPQHENWTTNKKLITKYADQYLLYIEKVD